MVRKTKSHSKQSKLLARLVILGLVKLSLLSLIGQERVIFSSSTSGSSIANLKTNSQLEERISPYFNRRSNQSSKEDLSPYFPGFPVQDNSINPEAVKKLLDKRKNWIFQPTDQLINNSYSDKSTLGANSQFFPALKDGRPQSSVEKFIAGDKSENSVNRKTDNIENLEDTDSRDASAISPIDSGLFSKALKNSQVPDLPIQNAAIIDNQPLFQNPQIGVPKSVSPFAPSFNNIIPPVSSYSSFSSLRNNPLEEQRQRIEQFRQSLRGPDLINGASDLTRQPMQPVLPFNSDLDLGSKNPMDILARTPGNALPSTINIGLNPQLNLQPSAFNPVMNLPQTDNRQITPQPPVLEIPRRKF